jgi:hypothetical protein
MGDIDVQLKNTNQELEELRKELKSLQNGTLHAGMMIAHTGSSDQNWRAKKHYLRPRISRGRLRTPKPKLVLGGQSCSS